MAEYMKQILLLFVGSLFLFGCSEYTAISVDIGKELSVTVGSSMVTVAHGATDIYGRRAGGSVLKKDLLYGGRDGNNINIFYRETMNHTARPAYNMDLKYDLSKSDTITYKTIKIKVITADGGHILYRILDVGAELQSAIDESKK